MDDVKTFFTGGTWRTTDKSGSFTGWSDTAKVFLKPEDPKFRLHVESVDDPSDSGTFITSKPMKELAAFLGQDIPGGEHFERMSSSTPSRASRTLSFLASLVDNGEIGPFRLAKALRRLAVRRPPRTAEGPNMGDGDYIGKLQSEMTARGWAVKQEKDDRGHPMLRVDVSGIYEATVSVEEVTSDFEFEVIDAPETRRKGKTGDPIAEYRKYYRDPDIHDAAVNVRKNRSQESDDGRGDATVKPRGRPGDSGEAPTDAMPEVGQPVA